MHLCRLRLASMRSRGKTPRMPVGVGDPNGKTSTSMRPRGRTRRTPRMLHVRPGESQSGPRYFDEAAGAYPADASRRKRASSPTTCRFNEAAGADPADASASPYRTSEPASMRPRGQTPRMLPPGVGEPLPRVPLQWGRGGRPRGCSTRQGLRGPGWTRASMRPRGQTPRMPCAVDHAVPAFRYCFNEAAGADPADALQRRPHPDAVRDASMRPRGQTPRMRPLNACCS